jgi:AraC-like DNA-binding protein
MDTLSLRGIAEEFGYSAPYLTNLFHIGTGLPVTAWIVQRRIRAAEKLLLDSNAPVAAVAEAVGMNDLTYFSRQFARHVGLTPARFRLEQRNRSATQHDDGPHQ